MCRRSASSHPKGTEHEVGLTISRPSCGLAFICLGAMLSGCATAPLETSGSLSAYDSLATSNGTLTQSKLRVDRAEVLAARTVSISRTSFSSAAAQVELSDKQRQIIANAIDRSVCIGLSDRFQVVPPGQPADLKVHATVTHLTLTDPGMAGASKVVSAVPMFLSLSVPVPVPRIPIGMGSLSIESEARNAKGEQKAAMVWARAADSITSTARVSPAGDAYDLASAFGDDFSKLLVTGETPFNKGLSIPTMQRVTSSLGGPPKNAACDAFGRAGIQGLVGGRLGAPPEWSDEGAVAGN
ncbi:MAG TPA: DUF3313 domain-containing protein [Phyllobacterium sp.]|nr:DUF3313 domain-containing protein [Phyllobacterium sp.]